MFKFWQVYWNTEGGSGGGDGGEQGGAGKAAGADAGKSAAGDQGAAGGEGAGGDKGGRSATPQSLRALTAASLEGDERTDFEKWGQQYTTDTEFAKAMGSMRRQFDSRVPVPKQDAKPEELDKYFQRVGKPKDAKDYAFDWGKDEKGQPRQLDDTERGRFEGFKEFAHKNHLTQAQFENLVKFHEEGERKSDETFVGQINAAHQRSVDELRNEWGADFDNNANAAVEGGILYAPSEEAWSSFVELPLANGMKVGDHPTLLRTMAKIGRASGEDTRVRNMNSSGEAESIKAEIASLEQQALDAGELPSDAKWHKRIDPLYKKLYPKVHTASPHGGGGFGSR